MRPGHGIRNAVMAAVTAVVVTAGMTGCSDTDETPKSAASKAGAAIESATAAAASQMAKVKGGLNAATDVKAGPTTADGDRVTSEITATNPTGEATDYTVLVNWKDSDGNLLDATVVSIDGVPAGGTKSATARSNRSLTGTPAADIGKAVRH
ncbi:MULTISPECIES: hypothetical protein [unclassified Streptomyces]|uniref:hypothetical protein n=1 Tax=Streptomyces sp. NPDC006678 TaxID=3157185 RepID=UPI003408E5DD